MAYHGRFKCNPIVVAIISQASTLSAVEHATSTCSPRFALQPAMLLFLRVFGMGEWHGRFYAFQDFC